MVSCEESYVWTEQEDRPGLSPQSLNDLLPSLEEGEVTNGRSHTAYIASRR